MQLDNLLPFAFYQRITRRERVLLLLVVSTAFVLGNLIALSTIVRSLRTLRADYADKKDQWEFARHFVEDKAMWDQRVEWMQRNQQPMVNRDSASYTMLDQIQALGRQYGVIVTNPHIIPVLVGVKASPDYQALTIELDTHSDWGALLKFMHAVQDKPENFFAFDEARLRTEQADPSTIIGNFRISKWYKPSGGAK